MSEKQRPKSHAGTGTGYLYQITSVTVSECVTWSTVVLWITLFSNLLFTVDASSLRSKRDMMSHNPQSALALTTQLNSKFLPSSKVHPVTTIAASEEHEHAVSVVPGADSTHRFTTKSASSRRLSKRISRRQHVHDHDSVENTDTTISFMETEAEINHNDHHHGPSSHDSHEQEYHLHVHWVLFTSWWYVVALAIVEVVVYLITLGILRWMKTTSGRQLKRSHFSWRYSGNTLRL